jgi:flagellar protein FlgJ
MDISKINLINVPETLKRKAQSVEIKKDSKSLAATDPKEDAKLKKACQDFESIFLNQMLSKMREAVPKSDLMGHSQAEETFQGMLDDELAKQMSANGGIGLGATLYRQITERK